MSHFDRRFPWLCRIDNAPLEAGERRRASSFADAVGRRTGTACVYNTQTGGLFFYHGTIDRPAWEFPFKPDDEDSVRVTANDVDDVVRIIQMGKIDAAEKDRIAAQNKLEEAKDREQAAGRNNANKEKDAVDYAEFLYRRRRGVAKVSA